LELTGLGASAATYCGPRSGNPNIDFVAVNDLTSPNPRSPSENTIPSLGNLKNEIVAGEDFISVDGKKIKVFAQKDPPCCRGIQ